MRERGEAYQLELFKCVREVLGGIYLMSKELRILSPTHVVDSPTIRQSKRGPIPACHQTVG